MWVESLGWAWAAVGWSWAAYVAVGRARLLARVTAAESWAAYWRREARSAEARAALESEWVEVVWDAEQDQEA